ncbi:MAG: hypothetical protein XD63_1392 [Thermoanaerobacterales bacterium 50_218]|nr:MAG: hypothetical protein XD63_1392 [Thermoanaerobacterales bacterium 50_218]
MSLFAPSQRLKSATGAARELRDGLFSISNIQSTKTSVAFEGRE